MPGRRPPVRAAGGVVWRLRKEAVHIALVHRPRYDDWTLPKGKLAERETPIAAAVREVREELGSQVALSRRLPTIGYEIGTLRKRVDFWSMRHVSGAFTENDEVDEVCWLPPKQARARMSYAVERAVVADFAAHPVPDSAVVLVRHAKAGKRSEWHGEDVLRPLEAAGRTQARRLTGFLAAFRPDRVVSATPTRCVQTVRPFAEQAGLQVGVDESFSDDGFAAAPERSVAALLALAKPGRVSVVCSQGDAIPGLVRALAPDVEDPETRKGAAWVLSVVDGTIVSADYYDDAAR